MTYLKCCVSLCRHMMQKNAVYCDSEHRCLRVNTPALLSWLLI